jgi:hypothetical protein
LFGHGKRFLVQVPWFETTLAGKVWKVFKKCGLVVSMAAFLFEMRPRFCGNLQFLDSRQSMDHHLPLILSEVPGRVFG